MGEVYRAIDSVLERPVAVKLLSDRYAHESDARARFRREALAAARLSSANHVVTILDVGEHRGRPLIVMEFVAGGSVHDALRQRRVSREQALTWLAQTADALDRAHAEGIVHRDVKPANLLLDREGSVRVSDFGIASTSGADTITLPGTILGTVGYLSPEQARGEPATSASDRYSLAVVAFELLTGRRPFESDTATTEILAHLNAPVPKASSVGAGLPQTLDAFFERALAKDPADRPATCAELVRELRHALDRRGRAAEASASTRIEVAAAAPPPERIPIRHAVETAPTRRAAAVSRQRLPTRSPIDRWRRALPALTLVLVLGSAAVVVAAVLGLTGDSTDVAPHRPSKSVTTEVRRSPSGVALNEAGFARMQAGKYAAALPLLRRAVLALQGSPTLPEAYASYNLAFTRFALGRCEGVMGLLARSEQIQGYRPEIEALRARWKTRCAPASLVVGRDHQARGNGHGDGHGHARGKGGGGD